LAFSACSANPVTQKKATAALLAQIALRQQQIDKPTDERITQMQQMGMQTANLNVQRVYIYLAQKLTTDQAAELTALGITLYPVSWIPPVGNHPDGFMLADMPVNKIDQLAAKDYVIRLDTAEMQNQPQTLTPQ
jgi:adenine C2-methylase RlmN of 23S rRNA A2503 and tRNA A37